MTEQRQRGSRPKVDWQDDKVFENKAFIVQVQKLSLHYPRYSVQISAKTRDGRPTRFMPVEKIGQGIIEVRPLLADLIELVDSAEGYLKRELQKIEDQRIDDMQAREHRTASRGAQAPRPGLKELTKRDRRKRQP